MRFQAKVFVLMLGEVVVAANAAGQQFQFMEASVRDIHRAMQSGKLTCRNLVQQYLDRIKAYDQQGSAINAMLYVNPKAPGWLPNGSTSPPEHRVGSAIDKSSL